MNHPHLLGELLDGTAQRYPHKEAIVFRQTRLTWGEFNQQVNNVACVLLEKGVVRGDRIGIMATTRPEYLCVYMASARIGAVLVGFNILSTPNEVVRLANLTQPKLMVILDTHKDKPLAEPLIEICRTLPYIEQVVVMGDSVPEGAHSLTNWMTTSRPDLEAMLNHARQHIEPDDPVLIVFTSGSTGSPKAAVLTHRSITTNIVIQAREFGFRETDRALQNKPMSHVGGSTNLTLPAIAVGATLVFMDYFHPIKALEIVQQERVTILAQVPTMFIMEFNLPNFTDFDLSSVRLAIVGGAATPVPVMQRIMQLAETTITGYGMTETGGYVTFTCAGDAPDVIAKTVGKVAPEYELQIVDEHRQPLPQGHIGEVAMRGACVLKEYFDNPTETQIALSAEGWLYSGDVGFLDERGYLTLVDRRKEMYITGGYNVYPREVELYIAQHPDIALVAVLGVKDAIMGEVGVAFVTLKPNTSLPEENLRAYCVDGLIEYKIPRRFVLLDALPLTPLGKIDKPTLRKEML